MKKYFCFYCQQEVKPLNFWRWRFCSKCRHPMSDKGEGFYIVCDGCQANMPANAKNCLLCGHGLHGYPDKIKIPWQSTLISGVIAAFALILGAFLLVGILYISFNLLAVFALLGLLYWLFYLFKYYF